MLPNTRLGIEADYESYKRIVEDNKLIHPTELQKMLLKKELDSEWFTSVLGEEVVGVCYCCMEKVANKTVNMLLLAVSPSKQGIRIGSHIVQYAENYYKEKGMRLMVVETSTLPEFELTRKFYLKNGYNEQGKIEDFYDDGEGKVAYTKRLNVFNSRVAKSE
jgi:ribosomal protein S18 acetylase RimI-like enzyme